MKRLWNWKTNIPKVIIECCKSCLICAQTYFAGTFVFLFYLFLNEWLIDTSYPTWRALLSSDNSSNDFTCHACKWGTLNNCAMYIVRFDRVWHFGLFSINSWYNGSCGEYLGWGEYTGSASHIWSFVTTNYDHSSKLTDTCLNFMHRCFPGLCICGVSERHGQPTLDGTKSGLTKELNFSRSCSSGGAGMCSLASLGHLMTTVRSGTLAALYRLM